jgi:hypothetical protein
MQHSTSVLTKKLLADMYNEKSLQIMVFIQAKNTIIITSNNNTTSYIESSEI